jgi:hypothetical protein
MSEDSATASTKQLKAWKRPGVERLAVEKTQTRPGRGPDGWEYPDCTHS